MRIAGSFGRMPGELLREPLSVDLLSLGTRVSDWLRYLLDTLGPPEFAVGLGTEPVQVERKLGPLGVK